MQPTKVPCKRWTRMQPIWVIWSNSSRNYGWEHEQDITCRPRNGCLLIIDDRYLEVEENFCRQKLFFVVSQNYIISTTARLRIFPWLRSWNAWPASSNLYFLETALERLKIPDSASLTNLGRSCLALAPYEPITWICSMKSLKKKN